MLLENGTGYKPNSIKKVKLECDYCGDIFELPWRSMIKGHKIIQKDSCPNCRNKKREESCIKKYGCKIASQSSSVKKRTSLTKGGMGKNVADYKKDILEMYNIPYFSVNEMSKKIGVSRSVLISYMRELGLDTNRHKEEKRLTTIKNKYGKHFLQTEMGQNILKKRLKDKYGSENPYDNKEYKQNWLNKTTNTCLDKYGTKCILQEGSRQEEFAIKRANTIKQKNNGILITDVSKKLDIACSTLYERIRKWGFNLAIIKDKNKSVLEVLVANWLDSINIEYKEQVKIDNYIADFVINNIIIECDGLYWHSESKKDKYYHINKRKTYINNGYIPLFFRENEIRDMFPIVQSIILNKLNMTNKYYARKLKITEINKTSGDLFFQENHLMRKGRGRIFALVDDDILCAIRICKKQEGIYEVSRFCNRLNSSVIGGFSRLIKHVENILQPEEIITFIDQRYGQGNYLEKLGFGKIREQISFSWTDYTDTFHRMRYPGNIGLLKGLDRIWDCGQAKFVK